MLTRDLDSAALTAFLDSELKRWTALVNEAGLRGNDVSCPRPPVSARTQVSRASQLIRSIVAQVGGWARISPVSRPLIVRRWLIVPWSRIECAIGVGISRTFVARPDAVHDLAPIGIDAPLKKNPAAPVDGFVSPFRCGRVDAFALDGPVIIWCRVRIWRVTSIKSAAREPLVISAPHPSSANPSAIVRKGNSIGCASPVEPTGVLVFRLAGNLSANLSDWCRPVSQPDTWIGLGA